MERERKKGKEREGEVGREREKKEKCVCERASERERKHSGTRWIASWFHPSAAARHAGIQTGFFYLQIFVSEAFPSPLRPRAALQCFLSHHMSWILILWSLMESDAGQDWSPAGLKASFSQMSGTDRHWELRWDDPWHHSSVHTTSQPALITPRVYN